MAYVTKFSGGVWLAPFLAWYMLSEPWGRGVTRMGQLGRERIHWRDYRVWREDKQAGGEMGSFFWFHFVPCAEHNVRQGGRQQRLQFRGVMGRPRAPERYPRCLHMHPEGCELVVAYASTVPTSS